MIQIRCSRQRLFVLVVGLLSASQGAQAQLQVVDGCMQDVSTRYGGPGNLNCTANDISITAVTLPATPADPCDFLGDTTTFHAIAQVQSTATSRYDVGVYLALDSGNALTGSCLISTLPYTPTNNNGVCTAAGVPFPCCTGAGAGTCGYGDLDNDASPDTGKYCSLANTQNCNDNTDCGSTGSVYICTAAGVPFACCTGFATGNCGTCPAANAANTDLCGDIDGSAGGHNPVYYQISNITVTCLDTDNDGFLDVTACMSWSNQEGSGELCRSPLAAFPNTPSKCNCQPALKIPVPIPRTIQVCKDLIPSNDSGLFNLQVDGVTQYADANDGDCTSNVAVAVGNHTVGETAGTATSLAAYNTNISCVDVVGRCTGNSSISCFVNASCAAQGAGTCNLTPTPVGSCTNCTLRSLSISTQSTKIVCTITNTNICNNACGNGSCEAGCGENCTTCPADCGCIPCEQICNAGVCESTCGDGTCDPACEDCSTCPGDCGCNPCTQNCVGGLCVAACGDGTCDPTCENCSNCPSDCDCGSCNTCVSGTCTPDCGDGFCDPVCGENCNSCASDCGCLTCQTCNGGVCTPDCGNGVCQPSCGEDCSTCASDCGCPSCTHNCVGGACVPACGDGLCDPACENCSNCPADCGCDECTENCIKGVCVAACGDGICDPACENCDNCPSDCGCLACFTCIGGVCTSDCGNGTCDPACENCSTCPNDCLCPPCTTVCTFGVCTPTCGDGFCDPACEDCSNCPGDCPCMPCTQNCVGGACVSACGDGTCDPACENCSNCVADCACGPCNSCIAGVCEMDCGNGVCDPACENCNSCPADCGCPDCQTCVNGVCVTECGDGTCDPFCEDCSTCPSDCVCTPCTEACVAGECMLTCGDGTCDPTCENCMNCQADCGCTPCTQTCDMGVCEPTCGDGACDPGCENCGNCPSDCGCPDCLTCVGEVCISDCGDSVCDANCENCGTCPSDCPCDDGVGCTNDSCQSNACVYTPNDAKCTDKDICNGIETCDAVLGCLPGEPNACEPPSLTCPPDVECECDAEVCIYGDPVLVDDCSADPTYNCTEEITPGKLPQERTITRTCTTTNDCGASDSCVQVIEIVDMTPPVITCPGDLTCELACECGQPCEMGEPVVTDTCDPDPDVTVEVVTITNDCRQPRPCQTAGVSPPPKLIITNTYTVTDGVAGLVVATGDASGNTETCVQRVEIVDRVPPVLVSCSLDYEVCTGAPINFTPPGCTDTCGTCGVICVRSDGMPLDAPMPESPLTITCTATDECDNDSVCTIELALGSDCEDEIPTVSEWGLVVMALLLSIGAKVYFGRREGAQTT